MGFETNDFFSLCDPHLRKNCNVLFSANEDKESSKEAARRRFDSEKIRKFMKAKREKQLANIKKKKEAEEEAKLALKNRLMALDAKAASAASKVIRKNIRSQAEVNSFIKYNLLVIIILAYLQKKGSTEGTNSSK